MNEPKVFLFSDCEYEFLVAQMFVDDKYVGLISQEAGPDRLVVEFPDNSYNDEPVTREVDLETLVKLIEEARKALVG